MLITNILLISNLLICYYFLFKDIIIKNLNKFNYIFYCFNNKKVKCCICYEDLPYLISIKNNCNCKNKFYHIDCLYTWSKINNSCPICRNNIDNFIINKLKFN